MRRFLTVAALALVIPAQAHAVTAGDFLDSMNEDERAGFMGGAIDMLAYKLSEQGRGEQAACIVNWYFEGEGPHEIANAFHDHKDLPAVALLKTLAKRHCD